MEGFYSAKCLPFAPDCNALAADGFPPAFFSRSLDSVNGTRERRAAEHEVKRSRLDRYRDRAEREAELFEEN